MLLPPAPPKIQVASTESQVIMAESVGRPVAQNANIPGEGWTITTPRGYSQRGNTTSDSGLEQGGGGAKSVTPRRRGNYGPYPSATHTTTFSPSGVGRATPWGAGNTLGFHPAATPAPTPGISGIGGGAPLTPRGGGTAPTPLTPRSAEPASYAVSCF
jgi:hypothetical protein